MRNSDRLDVVRSLACVVALLAACSSSSTEEPPAAAATEGAEAVTPEQPPAPPPEAVAPPAPAEAPPPAAAVTPPPAPQPPPYSAVVIHDVKDYDAWKTSFDSDIEARKQGGIVGESVMRGVDNDKTAVVYLPATDLEKLKAMLDSKELKDKMKQAGVKGKPQILIFTSKLEKMTPDKTGLYGALMQYNVKDFAAFQTGFEAQDAARTAAGIIGYGVGQSVDKPTAAVVYLQSEDAAKLKEYLATKETKAAMKEAGAIGQPKTTVVQEGPMKMY